MSELPLWPPVVLFGLGLLLYAYGQWESRQFDKKYPGRGLKD